MEKKTYTLELTAEELETYVVKGNHSTVYRRAKEALRQARAEDDMHFPWTAAEERWDSRKGESPGCWMVRGNGPFCYPQTERAAKLMSAAPELLEAVCMVKVFEASRIDGSNSEAADQFRRDVSKKLDRALRKVETGTPEAA